MTRFVRGSTRARVPEPSFVTQTAPKAETAPPGDDPVWIRATTCGEELAAATATSPASTSLPMCVLHRGCATGSDQDSRERSAQLDEKRLEREARRELKLLEVPPGLADELRGALGGLEALDGSVLEQLRGPVGVDERALGPRGGYDEVPVPGGQLLECRQQLLALGAARCSAHALLGVAGRQLEPFDGGLLALLCLRGTRPSPLDSRSAAHPGSNSDSA